MQAGVLERRDVDNADGQDEADVTQVAANSSAVVATSAPATEWIDTKSSTTFRVEPVPRASSNSLAAVESSMALMSGPVMGSALMESSWTSFVEPVQTASSTSVSDLNTWSATAVTSSSNVDLPDQRPSTSPWGSQAGVEGIGLGAMDPLVTSSTGAELGPASTRTLAALSQEVETETLVATTRDTLSLGEGVFNLVQSTGMPDQPASAMDVSALSGPVPSSSVYIFSDASSPTAASGVSNLYPLGSGSTAYLRTTSNVGDVQETGDWSGRPSQSPGIFTYTSPTSSFPPDAITMPSLPPPSLVSASRNHNVKPSNLPGTTRYFHHHSEIDAASSTTPPASSTFIPQTTVVAPPTSKVLFYPVSCISHFIDNSMCCSRSIVKRS